MNSYHLVKKINSTIKVFNECNYFFEALELLRKHHESITKSLSAIVGSSGGKASQLNEEAKKVLGDAIKQFKNNISPHKIIVESEKIKEALVQDDFLVGPTLDNNMSIYYINDFKTKYEAYLKNYGLPATVQFVNSAKNLNASLTSLRNILLNISNKLETKEHIKEGMEVLSVYFASYTDYSDSIEKLSALKIIYSELSCLFNISETENPMQLIKIESGGLSSKFAGNPKIIETMKDLFDRFITYMFKNFTQEGKKPTISKYAEVIRDTLNLSIQLEDKNIDTSIIDENIQKASITLSKQLDILVAGQPVIEINEKTLTIGDEHKQKYLEESKTLMIEE